MRLPYAPTTPSDPSPENTAIYERIAARRAPRPLIPLDLALLHSPPVADGWNSFLGAIRSKTEVNQGLLELAVCQVAVLNGAVYEWNAHAPLALRGGVSPEGLQSAKREGLKVARSGEAFTEQREGGGLSRKEWVVLAYTDQMTRNVKVDEKIFSEVRNEFSEREIVELTAGIGAYNCVSRFLVALDVGEWNDKEMKSVEELVKDEKRKTEARA